MCTATWLSHADGFELFFNRDESLQRGSARPPELLTQEGVRCVAPVDVDAGGTWLGVNERGLALGLLNGWDRRGAPDGLRSRGLLVRDLLGARGASDVARRLTREELSAYRAFLLVVLEPGAEPALHAWDGDQLRRGRAASPLCSSSFDRGRAQREREQVFAQLRREQGALDAELLAAFQRSHLPERGPWSPCMHRAEACTVSSSRVRVDAREISFRYAPGSPCSTPFRPPVVLPRGGPLASEASV